MEAPLLQVCGSRVDVSDDADEISAAAAVFRDGWFLRLPGMLDVDTLARVKADVARTPFERSVHGDVGIEVTQTGGRTVNRLVFLLNQRHVLDLVARIARVPRLGCFIGRVYRMESGGDHYDDWHDDCQFTRQVALTLNVGEPNEGGVLLMRRKPSGEPVSIPNTTPGDAVLFRIDEELQHRVTDVTGPIAKTAFAGWFCVEPDFDERLRSARARS